MNDEEVPAWLKGISAEAATPAGEGDAPRPRPLFVLHPIQGVFWAAFLGSFCGGGAVMALNYARLGEKGRAWITLGAGFLATAALIALLNVLPETNFRPPWWAVGLPQGMIAAAVASRHQQVRILDHMRQGGRVASGWKGAGLGILCSLLILVLVVGFVWFDSGTYGERQQFGADEVYLLSGASVSDASRLAKSLQEVGSFGGEGAAVQIRKTGDQWVVGFIVTEETAQDPRVVETFENVGHHIATEALSYPLVIELCDSTFSVLKTISLQASPYGELGLFEGDRVYFTDGVRLSEARRVARTLKDMGWFEGNGLTVQLRRATKGYTVAFLVDEAAGNTPETFDRFRGAGEAIAEAGFGFPITIELSGRKFVPWKTIPIESAPGERQMPPPPVTL